MAAGTKVCALTGAHGFVGGRLRRYLERKGWRVVAWTRQPAPGRQEVAFRLGQEVDAGLLEGVDALVHCAYDFGPRRWADIAATNVAGSEKLLGAAGEAGVPSTVVISSISAFTGCRSLYGKAKLEIEACARKIGAHVIRPGLVYCDRPGGMFGQLVRQVRGSRMIPTLVGGNQAQYLLHDEDLGELVARRLEGTISQTVTPLTVAHPQAWTVKEIVAQIAEALGKRVSFVPVPWQCVWLALKTMELAGLKPNFRSDSLISMVYQDPRPPFAPSEMLGFECRPFRLSPGMLDEAGAVVPENNLRQSG